ncbi:hypothetical protein HMPREF1553_02228 [Porphyromonas gingivalis F0568]|nr:hypothetical protein HMPREF1553_02228 [Porphyromonas gingivalis F0568]
MFSVYHLALYLFGHWDKQKGGTLIGSPPPSIRNSCKGNLFLLWSK